MGERLGGANRLSEWHPGGLPTPRQWHRDVASVTLLPALLAIPSGRSAPGHGGPCGASRWLRHREPCPTPLRGPVENDTTLTSRTFGLSRAPLVRAGCVTETRTP